MNIKFVVSDKFTAEKNNNNNFQYDLSRAINIIMTRTEPIEKKEKIYLTRTMKFSSEN